MSSLSENIVRELDGGIVGIELANFFTVSIKWMKVHRHHLAERDRRGGWEGGR